MAPAEPSTPHVAVIGAGPAGLMAAETAASAGARVTVYDAMPSAGRKFLMAGRSGLNITHSEPFDDFMRRYGAAADWLRPMLERFSPRDMRAFCDGLGVETFVGSSGRVFPKTMKASPLLRAWLRRLAEMGVQFRTRARLVDFDLGEDRCQPHGSEPLPTRIALRFSTSNEVEERAEHDAVILALGGASWPRLGSTGDWADMLAARGVTIAPFRPSNCAVEIGWSDAFRAKFEGQPIKTARFSFGDLGARGEAVVTRRGLEGGPVYALASAIGAVLRAGGEARLVIDLKPDATIETLARKLQKRRKGDSFSNALRKTLGLSPLAIALLREASGLYPSPLRGGEGEGVGQSREFSRPPTLALPHEGGGKGADPGSTREIAGRIKSLALPVRAVAGLDRAISTAGGIARAEIDERLMLKKLPGVFVAGEMIDWDAPTGGYLLQACFATGKAAGEDAARWASRYARPARLIQPTYPV